MNIYFGLNKFKEVVENSSDEEKLNAWLLYYKEYQDVFDLIFQKLYMTDLHNMVPVIKELNVEGLLSQAERGASKHSISNMEKVLNQCIDYFVFEEDFDVFFLVGFGHIDGTAPPPEKPLLYFGLERLFESDIAILIPHEFNHLVRFHSLQASEKLDELTVKQLIIAEGISNHNTTYNQ